MVNFSNGPAAGHVLELRRAPPYLRVAVSGSGAVDALDQLGDRPAAGETLFAYRRVGAAGRVRICGIDSRTGQRGARALAMATYALLPDQPGQDVMRDTAAWRAWATAAAERERLDAGGTRGRAVTE